MTQTSRLQQAIDVAEALSLEEQNLLLEILAKRLHRKQRQQLLQEVQRSPITAIVLQVTVGVLIQSVRLPIL